jgi:hypothetical protein
LLAAFILFEDDEVKDQSNQDSSKNPTITPLGEMAKKIVKTKNIKVKDKKLNSIPTPEDSTNINVENSIVDHKLIMELKNKGSLEGVLQIISIYLKCAKDGNAFCLGQYEHFVANYQAPRCKEVSPNLGFFIADIKEGLNFIEERTFENRKYFFESKPFISGADFMEVYQVPDKEDFMKVGVRLTSSAKEDLKLATSENILKNACLVSESQILKCFYISSPINVEAFEVSVPVDKSKVVKNLLQSFCTEIEELTLPPEVQL